jgi:hypothetical protein
MIMKYMIENEKEADAYLEELLDKKEYRSISEITCRAQDLIKDEALRNYFINKGKDMLDI